MHDYLIQFIKPELLVLVPVLYLIGSAIKSCKLKDYFIPYILGAISIVLCGIWVLATSKMNSWQDVLIAIFTFITQGILVAGASVYVNQMIKQAKKAGEENNIKG